MHTNDFFIMSTRQKIELAERERGRVIVQVCFLYTIENNISLPLSLTIILIIIIKTTYTEMKKLNYTLEL